ncbi:divalent cation tolerance protein [Rhodovulum imhoffii]|uniref:Divalent cation tolerance protein n=1 Tax=Rhodovulum imhoffii TaxID=365340 RepID=A0A2T5BT89_9RHOB|nr:divalent cation tolerance protein CutA [Rhodovulum imhoffii]MBK5933826.1 divalent-cation tolerance protein CutA [Rhodovulum imhoffii]PTN02529.1 divalent cation tolerance protein [Rhodovulum imhoffii]
MIHVTTTCADLETARALARAALEARLAACANILPGVVSLFHWQGRVEEDAEVQITFKTTEVCRPGLVDLIGDRHPYDLPVIAWETAETTSDCTGWLSQETAP